MRKLAVQFALLLGFWASGQTPEQLYRNVGRLRISVSLDRELYLPNEAATVTITLTNPTNAALVIPKPFDTRTGSLMLYEWSPEVRRYLAGDEDFMPATIDANTPTVTLAPNEVKTLTFRSDELVFGGRHAGFLLMPLGPDPSRWRVNYYYTWSAEGAAFFRVENGDSTDQLISFPVPGPATYYKHVAVIRQGAENVLALDLGGTKLPERPSIWLGKPYTGFLTGLVRVATTTEPISNVDARVDALNRIVLHWTEGANLNRTALFDLNVRPIP